MIYTVYAYEWNGITYRFAGQKEVQETDKRQFLGNELFQRASQESRHVLL